MVYRQTPRSARVRAASRTKLLAAARKLFAKRGYGATTMREVAKQAGTSIGNLYFYFADKDELLGTLLAETRGTVWLWAEDAAAAAPAGAARLAIIAYANMLRLLTVDSDLMRLFVTQGAPPALSERVINDHLNNLRGHFTANFPNYPPDQVEVAISAWSGAVRRCGERFVRGEIETEPLAMAEFVIRWNFRGMGLPESEIDEALAIAARAMTTSGEFPAALSAWEGGRSSRSAGRPARRIPGA